MVFVFILFLSLSVSLLLIPVFKRIAKKYQLVDIPKGDALKIHKTPISYLGGTALFISVTASLLTFGFLQNILYWKLGAVILASIFIFALGFWDDLRWKHISNIKPHTKFLLLVAAPFISAILLLQSGFYVGPPWWVFLISLYIFVLMNSVNYQDGMDGLAGGLSFISFIGFIVISLSLGNIFALGISLILLGAVLGFLVFNFPPAKVFMGDSGAYFLGFYLALLALIFSDFGVIHGVLGPIFIIGVPLFEGVFTNVRRVVQGKSIFFGDRDHTYDVLLKRGYSTSTTLMIFYSAQLISMAFGVWLLL